MITPGIKVTPKSQLTTEQLGTLARLQLKLSSLGAEGDFLPEAMEGPVVTLYKFVPRNATRVGLIERLSSDLAIAISAECVQVSRIPGESAIGIYVPNKIKKLVSFRDTMSEVYKNKNSMKLPICFGIDHMGRYVIEDLTRLPHLLIAGSTGTGKSTFMNSVIASLLYCYDSKQLRLVLSDTKQVEFTHFAGAPHFMFPTASSVPETIDQWEFVVTEINDRLTTVGKAGCQNILQYNIKNPNKAFPYIVMVVDELADPLSTMETYLDENDKKKKYSKKAEHSLSQIVQKARATGIHVIAAVQRPSVKVVEGNIKANFPARVSFKLVSEADSRTVFGTAGAEQLLSQGDMFFLSPNSPAIKRCHAPLVSITDIQAAVEAACRKEE